MTGSNVYSYNFDNIDVVYGQICKKIMICTSYYPPTPKWKEMNVGAYTVHNKP